MSYYLNHDPSKKFRTFFFRTYVDPLPIIQDLKGLNHYAYIKHDRDVLSDGTLKKPHFHVVVSFTNPRYETAVGDVILSHIPIEQQNCQCFALSHTDQTHDDKSIRYAIRYLIHADDDTKATYYRSEISTDYDGYIDKYLNMSTAEVKTENREAENVRFIRDLFELDPLALGIRYGRDYIKNYNSYETYKSNLSEFYGVTSASHVDTHYKLYKGEEVDEMELLTLQLDEGNRLCAEYPYEYSSDGKALLMERVQDLTEKLASAQKLIRDYRMTHSLHEKKG